MKSLVQLTRTGADLRSYVGRRRAWLGVVAVLIVLAVAVPRVGTAVTPPWRGETPAPRHHATLTAGTASLEVELALTDAQRALGLSYREGLRPGTGMLFVYPDAGLRSFWMPHMRFCLDIIWIEGQQIVGAAEGVCPSAPGMPSAQMPRYPSPAPVTYVLEVPAGWLAGHDLRVGAPVTITMPSDTPAVT